MSLLASAPGTQLRAPTPARPAACSGGWRKAKTSTRLHAGGPCLGLLPSAGPLQHQPGAHDAAQPVTDTQSLCVSTQTGLLDNARLFSHLTTSAPRSAQTWSNLDGVDPEDGLRAHDNCKRQRSSLREHRSRLRE